MHANNIFTKPHKTNTAGESYLRDYIVQRHRLRVGCGTQFSASVPIGGVPEHDRRMCRHRTGVASYCRQTRAKVKLVR